MGQLNIRNEEVPKRENLPYVGSVVGEEEIRGECCERILLHSKVEISAFYPQMPKVKGKFYRCIRRPVMSYASESWRLKKIIY